MDLDFKRILITKSENVGIITLNRPDIHNIINFVNIQRNGLCPKAYGS